MAKKEPKAASGSSTRKIIASGSSKRIGDIKQVKPGSMATNPKLTADKKPSTKYSPELMGMYKQYDMARTAKKKMDAKAEEKKLKSTKYAPTPMTAKQKETIRRAAEKKQAAKNIKKDLTKVAGVAGKVAGKVVGRAKTVGREARDVVTAVGSAAQAVRKSPQENMPVAGAIKNVAKQVKEVGKAAVTGKKGTTPYKFTPNAASQKNRKERGSKGYVFYDIKNPKNR